MHSYFGFLSTLLEGKLQHTMIYFLIPSAWLHAVTGTRTQVTGANAVCPYRLVDRYRAFGMKA